MMDISSRIAAYGGHSVIETTLGIIVTAGTVLYGTGTEITNPVVFSQSLEPVLGPAARIIGDLGLFLAGLSSSIATPFIAIFFVISGNNKKMLGSHTNSVVQNILGGIACAVTLAMGMNMLWNNVIMKLIG